MEANETQTEKTLIDFSAQITNAVEKAAPSIVAIDARPRVATSGIVWRAGGIIVATNHTIRRDDEITIILENGQTARATLVGRDAGCDLAILKIDDEEIAKNLNPVNTKETKEIKVGNFVLAIGRTNVGSGVTASFGIINNVSAAWRTWRGDEIERFINLDLTIRLGFSGSALINADGQVLGVNTSAFGRGLALTIPSETVNRVVDHILSNGSAARPYLGIGTQAVPLSPSLRERLNLEQSSGLIMLTVEADGAAEKAGILIGDILLSIENQPTTEPSDVQAALRERSAGDAVKAKLLRGGELKEIEIILGARPAGQTGERPGRGGRNWRRGGWR